MNKKKERLMQLLGESKYRLCLGKEREMINFVSPLYSYEVSNNLQGNYLVNPNTDFASVKKEK